MSFKLKAYKDSFIFIPLGGCNEIGINVNLYQYKGKWIMVDCGAGFADEYLPGVDMVVADLTFIEENKHDLLGLILTHAHEDHIGAIQYLWNSLECPIYTTRFTANFLKLKIAEYEFSKKIEIIELEPGKSVFLDPFSIEMVPLTHSAPEMQAIMIRTVAGNVLHTGDWKFDPNPIIGYKNNEEILKSYGDEGVLALVCDSTNVLQAGSSGSEGELRGSLVDIIAGCKQMVVATTFASNLARLDSLIHAGEKAGRKIVLSGRSLRRMMEAAQASGYLQNKTSIIDESQASKHPRDKLLIISTGCQGEPMAATAKMANHSHPIKLAAGDTVIFSSKIIPGNETKIFRLFNAFAKQGVEVITEQDHFVHVSGHPAIEELKRMYALIRPNICLPVHGEPVHIYAHAKLAKSIGIPVALKPENGDVILLEKNNAKVVDKVESGYLAVDGSYLLPTNSPVFKMRRRMRDEGLVVVSLFVNKEGQLMAKPVVSLPGIFDTEVDNKLISEVRNKILEEIQDGNRARSYKTRDQLEASVRSNIRRILRDETDKSPIIIVNVEYPLKK